jgi:hypothetical protein
MLSLLFVGHVRAERILLVRRRRQSAGGDHLLYGEKTNQVEIHEAVVL